ncbi:hypothetical protein EB061_11970 [bacterium]|nr:hypothetical protein [bacterium]
MADSSEPAKGANAIVFDWPFGSEWWLQVSNLFKKRRASPPAASSGGGVGTLFPVPYAHYDEAGRRITGQVVVVESIPNNRDTFRLPDMPQATGYMLKVVNATDRPIRAMFPYVFTYYGSAVYGQEYGVGAPIYPYEAGIYRVTLSEQNKVVWEWQGAANQALS